LSLKKKIYNCLPDLSVVEIIDAHREVIKSISKLNDLINSEYVDYNLTNIIMPKAYGNYTILDTAFFQYWRIKDFLQRIVFSDNLSSSVAHYLIKKKRSQIHEATKDNKYEIPMDYSRIDDFISENYDDHSFNLFSTGTQTYLRVMILYMNQSQFDNHLLIIPKCLKNAEVLKNVKSAQLLFFENYITNEIKSKYEAAKVDFAYIFNSNEDKIREIFMLDSKDFFQLIDTGLKNIFHYLLPQAYLFYLVNEEIYRQVKVKNVIGARVRKIYDRALYQSAAKQNINRYVLMHSNIGTDYKFLDSMGHFMDLTGVFAWGDLQKQLIEGDPFSNVENIYVTGSPLFTKEINNRPDPRTKIILYASSYNDFREVKALVRITNSLPENTQLIIKVHPHIDYKEYEGFINSEKITLVPGERSLEDLLPMSDLLITTISESALQAMIRGVPALFFLLTERWKKLGYDLYGFDKKEENQLVINSKELLEKRINELLFSDKYRSVFLKNQNNFLNKRIRTHPDNNGAANEIDKILN